MRISDVAAKAKMTRASARRYLLTLKDLGYIGSEGDLFYPMPRILELGYSFVSSARLEEFVEPILKSQLKDKYPGAASSAPASSTDNAPKQRTAIPAPSYTPVANTD